MNVVYTDVAARHIRSHVAYLIDRDARQAAERLFQRVRDHVTNVIAPYPKAGRWIAESEIYEAWVPRTPIVILYEIDIANEAVVILAVFHGAQDRSSFEKP